MIVQYYCSGDSHHKSVLLYDIRVHAHIYSRLKSDVINNICDSHTGWILSGHYKFIIYVILYNQCRLCEKSVIQCYTWYIVYKRSVYCRNGSKSWSLTVPTHSPRKHSRRLCFRRSQSCEVYNWRSLMHGACPWNMCLTRTVLCPSMRLKHVVHRSKKPLTPVGTKSSS